MAKKRKPKPRVKQASVAAPLSVFAKPPPPVVMIYPPPPVPLTRWEEVVKYLKSLY